MLLLLPLAHADVAFDTGGFFDCTVPVVVATVPATGQVNVPVDARMVALFGENCGDSVPSLTLSLLRQDDASTVDEVRFTDSVAMSLYTLVPTAELDPDTAYTFRVTPDDGWGEMSEIGFTTGYGHVIGLDTAPALDMIGASWDGETETVSAEFDVTPAADPDRLSVVTLVESSGRFTDAAFVPSVYTPTGFRKQWLAASAPDEVCFTATQLDGTGVATAGTQACVEADGGCGCESAGGGATLAVVVGALVSLAARRRYLGTPVGSAP